MTSQANKPSKGTSKPLGDPALKAIAKKLKEADAIVIKQKKTSRTDLNKAYDNLKFYLGLGYSFKRACILSGEKYKTLYEYYSPEGKYTNKAFQTKCQLAGSEISLYARHNITEAIKDGSIEGSTDWLERIEGDEFSRVIKTEDVTERDEGVLLLREIIRDRRLYVKRPKQLKEGKKKK